MVTAYDRLYLPEAKLHLGKCTDYLIRDCSLDPETVASAYSTTIPMQLFARGDPGMLAGKSGLELGMEVYRAIFGSAAKCPEPIEDGAGRSPEYWGGWALAHFQWHWCKSFKWIFERTTMTNLLSKYRVYHEMNVERFLEDFMTELGAVETVPHLKRFREAAGFSQSQLAKVSGVNIRNIQLYEQRVQPIERASAATLSALSRPLGCTIEDLLD